MSEWFVMTRFEFQGIVRFEISRRMGVWFSITLLEFQEIENFACPPHLAFADNDPTVSVRAADDYLGSSAV